MLVNISIKFHEDILNGLKVIEPRTQFFAETATYKVRRGIPLKYMKIHEDTPQGSPGVGRDMFLSSPHLCFIIVFICDLFVSRDDPLMS